MNLFRSEEHLTRWLEAHGQPKPGESLSVELMCDLAHAWFENRLAPDFRPRTLDESQAILERLGLKGGFWRLA